MSFRIDNEHANRINTTVDDSTFNVSSLMRVFIVAGFELLDSDDPTKMPRDIEKLWRDLRNVAEERARRLAFKEYQSGIAGAVPGAGNVQDELEAKIEKLEAMIEKLTAAPAAKAKAARRPAQKSKPKRKAQ